MSASTVSCEDFDATNFCSYCECFVPDDRFMSDRCKLCHDRIWAELQEDTKSQCKCDKCNGVITDDKWFDRSNEVDGLYIICAKCEGENGRPVFAKPITEWIDKMVHRDVNNIPWMWIEFAGFDDDDNMYSEWIGVFDKK